MLQVESIRELHLAGVSKEQSRAFISAASGLLKIQENFWVIADDELGVAKFRTNSQDPGVLFQIFRGQLPANPKERKKSKPDLESLSFLNEMILPPFGAILTTPSGSTPLRTKGALLCFTADQEEFLSLTQLDFAPLFAELSKSLPELNIEGVLAHDSTLKLFQRGNGKSGQNAIIHLSLPNLLREAQTEKQITRDVLLKITPVNLGSLCGVPLGFTDAALSSEGEIWYLAAAEKSESTYEDGQYSGAVIGKINKDETIEIQFELDCPVKPEGFFFDDSYKEETRFFIVTDADDANLPSLLLQGKISNQ